MTSRYTPEIGDVVKYKGKRMVIIKKVPYSFTFDYQAYLIEEETLKKSVLIDFALEELDSKCAIDPSYINLKYSTIPYSVPFTKVGTLPIKVQEISHIKVILKE